MNLRHTVRIISASALLLSPWMLRAQDFRSNSSLDSTPPAAESRMRFPSLFGPHRVAVMLIGDSLSFGPFGEHLESLLKKTVGDRGVCVFASCGSSPESWIDGEPVYVTKCGYRQVTPNPRESVFKDFEHGRKPPLTPTPKLGQILSCYRPSVVLIQQGTNWMDGFNPENRQDYLRLGSFIRSMILEIRSRSPESRIIWILPPAASKYPQVVQSLIAVYIRSCAVAFHFQTIDSRKLTGAYIKGVTGSDGVHYAEKPAQSWADKVFLRLKAMAPELIAKPTAG
jgi:hypothetical protein